MTRSTATFPTAFHSPSAALLRASAGMELGTTSKEFVLSVSSDGLSTAWRSADGGMLVLASRGWAILLSRAGGSNDALLGAT